MKEHQGSAEQALEEAVSRALRDNLIPLQRTANELHQAYADLVAACASSRPSNALPAMLRAQTAASALAAGLSVLSNFMAVALKPRERDGFDERPGPRISVSASALAEAEIETPSAASVAEVDIETFPPAPVAEVETQIETPPAEPAPSLDSPTYAEPESRRIEAEDEQPEQPVAASTTETPGFDVANLPSDMQDLHRRANRVAKVAMQDIKLLRPKDVRLGRENNDICIRLRSDLDKARKEYDRRFQSIQDHPVDYFHHWMVEILAEGNVHALGDYPYPSPVLRH